jgi:hypothetical protein
VHAADREIIDASGCVDRADAAPFQRSERARVEFRLRARDRCEREKTENAKGDSRGGECAAKIH